MVIFGIAVEYSALLGRAGGAMEIHHWLTIAVAIFNVVH